MDREALRTAILSHITPPAIADRVVDAKAAGILPDTGKNLRTSLQAAIDELSASGGGRLSLPAGVYLTGALHMKSGVELHLASPYTLLRFVCSDLENNYPLVLAHWEASPCYNYSPLLYACGAHDIAVTGPGTLDGGADERHWLNWHHQVEKAWSSDKRDMQLEDRSALRRMNISGVPVEERVFGPGHYLRPNFIQFIRCERVLLSGFTLHNSPMWQVNPVFCKSVIAENLTLSSHGANNDGFDPESCNGVVVRNCMFDTGDDCIAIKSGRDLDGRLANTPCENILIENNNFADGHGGVAMGSEMSGGIRNLLAVGNRFASPNLTYALRLKTNARRGGFVENIMLCDSVMDHVGGAAIHGTMLYEDGPNGDSLPVFRNITIENITAHGGDYGIFLEAFPEVPITGLSLRNIHIDGTRQALRSMSWQDAHVENVTLNGKEFPRPGYVRILGVPCAGASLKASAVHCGGNEALSFTWETAGEDGVFVPAGQGGTLTLPEGAQQVRVTACDSLGHTETSIAYSVLARGDMPGARLACRGMLPQNLPMTAPITRDLLAAMLMPLADPTAQGRTPSDTESMHARIAVANGFFPLDSRGCFEPYRCVTRREMATVCMQSCGVNYRNASSTMPVCSDAADVGQNYGTNVARALYFGFMELEDGRFDPLRPCTVEETIEILTRVADFAGL